MYSSINSIARSTPYFSTPDEKTDTQPSSNQETEKKAPEHPRKPADSSPVKKEVRFREGLIIQEIKKHSCEDPASTDDQDTEASQQKIMLDHLCEGSPEDLSLFTQAFEGSTCVDSIISLNKLLITVGKEQHELSYNTKIFFLKTYMEYAVEHELQMCTNLLKRPVFMGKTNEWLRNLELERTKALSFEYFSEDEIKAAKQARAEEIAARLNVPLPDKWEDLPKVSHELPGIFPDPEADKAARLAKTACLTEALLPYVEEKISAKRIAELKPAFDAWVQESLSEEKEEDKPKLNTLNDFVLYVEGGMEIIVNDMKEHISALPAANFKTVRPQGVQQIMEQLLREKYMESGEDSNKPATE